MVSLFTNVPINKAMAVIGKRLGDKTLKNRTNLTPDDVMSLLEFVMLTTYFQSDGEFYQQVHGAPMGSPVSVVVADMYMEDLEEEAMGTAPQDIRPAIWRRYINDSFEVVKQDKRDELTAQLNSIDTATSICSNSFKAQCNDRH